MSRAVEGAYRVGLVGCGHIAASHLRGWSQARGGEVTGVLDLNGALATALARRFGVEKTYLDLDELLADCDVVDICTPPQSHAAILTRAIEAGRRLVIEKPAVVNVAEWVALSDKIRAADLELAVVHHLKFARSFQRCKQWLDQGRIGRVLRIDWQFLTSRETDRMLTGSAHWSHELPGGRWFETLPHNLYGIHYLCGAMELASVTARRTASAPRGASADEVLIVLELDGCIGTIHFSASCRSNQRAVTLIGTEGSIHLDLLSDLAWHSRPRDTKTRRGIGRALIDNVASLMPMLADRAGYALDRIRGESPHTRFIAAVDRRFRDLGPAPTPFEEIDYVIRYSDRIGREIDSQLQR